MFRTPKSLSWTDCKGSCHGRRSWSERSRVSRCGGIRCRGSVATEDRTVQPDLERAAAKRMSATTVELKSSHVPMLSQPRDVLDVIRRAAAAVAKA